MTVHDYRQRRGMYHGVAGQKSVSPVHACRPSAPVPREPPAAACMPVSGIRDDRPLALAAPTLVVVRAVA